MSTTTTTTPPARRAAARPQALIAKARRAGGGHVTLAAVADAARAVRAAGDSISHSELYAALEEAIGACPIEAGVLGNLADHECPHDQLATDKKFDPECFCWPRAIEQNGADVIALPVGRRTRRPARPAAVAGSPEREQLVARVAELIERLGRDPQGCEYEQLAHGAGWPSAPSTRGWRPVVLEARARLRTHAA